MKFSHVFARAFILSLSSLLFTLEEKDLYPQHIAKGDNAKCCRILASYLTVPQHLIAAQHSPEKYNKVFNFYRWKYITHSSDDLKSQVRIKAPEVTRFNKVSDLTPEDRTKIKDGKYRIQQTAEDSVHIYLTSHTEPIVEYFNTQFEETFSQANKQ